MKHSSLLERLSWMKLCGLNTVLLVVYVLSPWEPTALQCMSQQLGELLWSVEDSSLFGAHRNTIFLIKSTITLSRIKAGCTCKYTYTYMHRMDYRSKKIVRLYVTYKRVHSNMKLRHTCTPANRLPRHSQLHSPSDLYHCSHTCSSQKKTCIVASSLKLYMLYL